MRLKSWETPRKSGVRNHKGKSSPAKMRQKRKQINELRKKLKEK